MGNGWELGKDCEVIALDRDKEGRILVVVLVIVLEIIQCLRSAEQNGESKSYHNFEYEIKI